jgi:transcriptional regulator with XRE-family HTH domain
MVTTVSTALQLVFPPMPVTLVSMTTLQERLTQAMKAGEKTRADLARACGMTRQGVGKWFDSETKNLKLDNLFDAADELGVDARWLATGKGTMKRGGVVTALPPDIPQRRIDLIRMYGRLPEEVRLPIRQLIETLAWQHHPSKAEYVKRQKKPMMVHEE